MGVGTDVALNCASAGVAVASAIITVAVNRMLVSPDQPSERPATVSIK